MVATTNNEQGLKNELVLPTFSKRLFSFIVDFFLIGLTFLILQAYLTPIIADKVFNINETAIAYGKRLVDSGLYLYVTDTDTGKIAPSKIVDYYTISSQDTEEAKDNYFQIIDQGIISYYENESFYYENEDFGINAYNQRKIDSQLFIYNTSTEKYEKTSMATFNSLKNFYDDEYQQALSFLSIDTECLNLSRKITIVSIAEVLFSLTIPLVGFYLVIPLCLKNGATLGKKLMGIGVASRKNGFAPSKVQFVMRFFAFYLLEFILSIFTLGIPLLVSFTMMFFHKEKIYLHDYLAATICVDTHSCVIFKNKSEFMEHHRKLESLDNSLN